MSKNPLSEIHLKLGHCGMEQHLGGYYLDFTGAFKLIETGFHGPLDNNEVPLNSYAEGDFYSIIVIAQYALALHDALRIKPNDAEIERKLKRQCEAISIHIERAGAYEGFFIHRWNNPKYPQLRAPWVSALTQGNAISALLRCYQLWEDETWLHLADSAFRALAKPFAEGGVLLQDGRGHFWLEEYPMQPPSHVLNGFIFALWGVLDYARVTDDAQAWEWWNRGLETLRERLAGYDCGFWSVYDLGHRELANEYYQINVHVPQLEAMHALTGEAIFADYATRWKGFSRSRWQRTQWWLALRWHARLRRWTQSKSDVSIAPAWRMTEQAEESSSLYALNSRPK